MDEKNLKVRRTRTKIRDALLLLLEKKELRQISIKEICNTAGINRATFYNHYGSQYDVLDDIKARYLTDIEKLVGERDAQASGKPDAAEKADMQMRSVKVLQYMEDNLFLSRMLLENITDDLLIERIFNLPRIENLVHEGTAEIEDDAAKNAITEFSMYGAFGMLRGWLNKDTRISAERETELILKLLRNVFSE